MACDAQTLATLSATNKAAALSLRGLAEAIAAQAAQHSGGTPFDPSQLAGLFLWLDASNGPVLAGNDVNSWNDRSPSKSLYVGNVSPSIPQFDPIGINGKPAVHFDGSAYLTGDLGIAGVDFPFTIFAVVKTDLVSDVQVIIGCDNIASLFYLEAAGSVLDYYNGPAGGDTRSDSITAYTNGVAFLAEMTDDGVTIPSLFANGASLTTANVNTTGPNSLAADHPLIGTSDVANQTFNFHGYIAEIVVYGSVLVAADRQKVEAYLNTKYGLGF